VHEKRSVCVDIVLKVTTQTANKRRLCDSAESSSPPVYYWSIHTYLTTYFSLYTYIDDEVLRIKP